MPTTPTAIQTPHLYAVQRTRVLDSFLSLYSATCGGVSHRSSYGPGIRMAGKGRAAAAVNWNLRSGAMPNFLARTTPHAYQPMRAPCAYVCLADTTACPHARAHNRCMHHTPTRSSARRALALRMDRTKRVWHRAINTSKHIWELAQRSSQRYLEVPVQQQH